METEANNLAHRVINRMMDGDAFSRWLGIERLDEGPGHCILKLVVRPEMLNGFHIAHGGIAFSLADSALAFASNAYGDQAVSVETSISLLRPVNPGDTLLAEARELHRSRQFARYQVHIRNQDHKQVALFTGTVFYTGKSWQV
jgi:acyl-CoA thioesterase